MDDVHPWIGKRRENMGCVVARAIVDRDDFEVLLTVLSENASEALGQVPAVVIARNDKADPWPSIHTVTRFCLTIRAGTPTTVTFGETSSITTAPAPTMAPAPMETLSMIVAPAPT